MSAHLISTMRTDLIGSDDGDTLKFAAIVSPKRSDILNSELMSSAAKTQTRNGDNTETDDNLDVGEIYVKDVDEPASVDVTPFKRKESKYSDSSGKHEVKDLYDIHDTGTDCDGAAVTPMQENPAADSHLLRGVSKFSAFAKDDGEEVDEEDDGEEALSFVNRNPLHDGDRSSVGGSLYDLYHRSSVEALDILSPLYNSLTGLGSAPSTGQKPKSNRRNRKSQSKDDNEDNSNDNDANNHEEFEDYEDEDEYQLNEVVGKAPNEEEIKQLSAREKKSDPLTADPDDSKYVRDLWKQSLATHQNQHNQQGTQNAAEDTDDIPSSIWCSFRTKPNADTDASRCTIS